MALEKGWILCFWSRTNWTVVDQILELMVALRNFINSCNVLVGAPGPKGDRGNRSFRGFNRQSSSKQDFLERSVCLAIERMQALSLLHGVEGRAGEPGSDAWRNWTSWSYRISRISRTTGTYTGNPRLSGYRGQKGDRGPLEQSESRVIEQMIVTKPRWRICWTQRRNRFNIIVI